MAQAGDMAVLRAPPVAILAAIAACGPLAVGIFVPALPAIAVDLRASTDTVQWTLSLYFLGVALGQLVYGPLSDMHGRRGVVLGGIGLYALSCFGCYAAWSIQVLILARFLQAVGGCVGMVISRAVIQDVFPGERYAAALSTVIMVSAVAPMLAPSLGGYVIDWFGWRQIFLILGVGGCALVFLCWVYLHETHHHRAAPGQMAFGKAYLTVLGNPLFLLSALSIAIMPSTYYAFLSGAPYLVISRLHWTAANYGTAAMTAPAGYLLGNLLASRISARMGNWRMVIGGVSVSALGIALALGLVIVAPQSAWSLFVPIVIVAFGQGLAMTSGISRALSVVPALAGSCAAVIGCSQMLAASLISKITGFVINGSPIGMLLVMAGAHLLSCGLFLADEKLRRGGALK
jgi:DHA1 family bicyclomycin/chloramphenicol resistance-like MFS transporter